MKTLHLLSRLCAFAAGLLLTGIALLTCLSVGGRNTTGWTIVGDFELAAAASGAALALFLPLCQIRRGNLSIDFFTVRAPARVNAALDRFGALLLSACMFLLAWRSALGALNAWETQAGSMMLNFPEWAIYCAIVPATLLTALIALVQAVRGDATGAA